MKLSINQSIYQSIRIHLVPWPGYVASELEAHSRLLVNSIQHTRQELLHAAC